MGRAMRTKNKIRRENTYQAVRKKRTQEKLKKRLEIVEEEKKDPELRKQRLATNVPRTLDNTREFDPSMLTANPAASSSNDMPNEGPSTTQKQPDEEAMFDISTDPFASYFNPSSSTSGVDPESPVVPKVLITTCQKATRASYEFCEEIVDVFPGSEFIRRKKGQGFEVGRIAGWAAKRGYGSLIVVNESRKKADAITIVHLPSGPTAYFKLSSIQLTKEIYGHARATPHSPELVLNNFVTRLGHTVGRMFQTLFPPLPEFQGRQVVTLHNQRDFLFFRRHRYAFRSPEKAALQEIGPRFTLKLRWLKRGLPGVGSAFGFGEHPPALEVVDVINGKSEETGEDEKNGGVEEIDDIKGMPSRKMDVTKGGLDEYEWIWKPELETTRRTFFL